MNWRSPFFLALAAGVAVLVAAFVPVAWQMTQQRPPEPARGQLPAPWQIERGSHGELRAFGLQLPGSTLADAVQLWGDELQVAVIESRSRAAALEAYTERWTGGGVSGKLVLATDARDADVVRWRDRARKRETIDADAQRWLLRGDDLADALRSGVLGLSFLPASRVDANLLESRFGRPPEVVDAGEGLQHWLYPDRGLAIAWDPGSGKAVLQLVAASDFDQRLRAPLTTPSERRP